MNPYLHNYDRHLSRSCRKLPVDALHPLPSLCWPEENITLYMKYRTWLFEGGAGYTSASNIYMPIAGHILGLNPVPYPQWDLAKDPEKVLAFARARGGSAFRMRMTGLAMNKFRRFIRLELGMKEAPRFKPFATERYIAGFPDWLATELGRYQRSLERNWRPTRVQANLQGFWSKQGRMWRFLCEKQGVKAFSDLKRVHILAFIDHLLDEKYASSTVNCYLLNLRGFLVFLQQEGYSVPQALLRVKTLKTPDSLPKYLNDEQIIRLRDAILEKVSVATTLSQRRQALLDQAVFYILWHGGLRLGEVEDLRMEDLDLSGRRLSVRTGKGQKDRTVYLTKVCIQAIQQYLAVRGANASDHVFIYHHAPLNRSFVGSRLKTLGGKAGVSVYAHQLRHTCATQLLNAGCRITSIQKILGHKNINTTLIYAKAYNQTVADDFYAAMERVEARLDLLPEKPDDESAGEQKDEVVKVPAGTLQKWVELLSCPDLAFQERLGIASKLQGVLQSHGALRVPG